MRLCGSRTDVTDDSAEHLSGHVLVLSSADITRGLSVLRTTQEVRSELAFSRASL